MPDTLTAVREPWELPGPLAVDDFADPRGPRASQTGWKELDGIANRQFTISQRARKTVPKPPC